MPAVAFYLARNDAKKETIIYARISYYGMRLKYYTNKSILPLYWNPKLRKVKETAKFPQHPEFNRWLNDFISTVDAVLSRFQVENKRLPATDELKKLLDKIYKNTDVVTKKATLFTFYEDLVKQAKAGTRFDYRTKKAISYDTAKHYGSSLNRLKEFQKGYHREINFENVDLSFYHDYIEYLTEQKLSKNYIGDNIKRLKAVLNDATEKGINSNLTFRNRYFIKPSEETHAIYLTEAELGKLEELNLSDDTRLNKTRDLFLIGCRTGLRYSDFSRLEAAHIENDMIRISQKKTGAPVIIPLLKEAKRILQKNNGIIPKPISNQKMNIYLKELCKKVDLLKAKTTVETLVEGKRVRMEIPRHDLVSTHTARRTFATLAFLKGIDASLIMKITGHTTEAAFKKYIKLTVEEHAKNFQRDWESRSPNLEKV